MKKMLEQLGLEPGRIRLEWVSAAEGDKFARVVTEFTEEVRALGPLEWKIPDEGPGHGEIYHAGDDAKAEKEAVSA